LSPNRFSGTALAGRVAAAQVNFDGLETGKSRHSGDERHGVEIIRTRFTALAENSEFPVEIRVVGVFNLGEPDTDAPSFFPEK
jgi:hypothetical protein